MKDEKESTESINLMDHKEYSTEFFKLMSLREKIEVEEKELNQPSKGVLEEIEDAKQKNINAVLAGADPADINYVEIYRNNLYNKTQKRIKVYRLAEEKQKKILDNVRSDISRTIATKVKPKYEDIINNMCIAWIELGKYVIQERDLRESLNDNDIAFTGEFTAMPIYGVGDPRIYNSRFSGWLIEAVERGYFKSADIPKEFKDAWEKRDGVVIDSITRGY